MVCGPAEILHHTTASLIYIYINGHVHLIICKMKWTFIWHIWSAVASSALGQSVLFSGDQHDKRKAPHVDCAKFGGQFDVPLQGTNVVLDCPSISGAANRKVCCAAHFPTQLQAVRNHTYVPKSSLETGRTASSSSRGVGWNYEPTASMEKRRGLSLNETDLASAASILHTGKASARASATCTVTKEYISSPQELRELAIAHRISQLGSASLVNPAPLSDGTKLPLDVHNTRLDALLAYVTSEGSVVNATRWLDRVRAHMQSADPASASLNSADDYEFLSRFEVTRRCSNGETTTWQEWIEPITVTARHPFGFSSCRTASAAHQTLGKNGHVGRSNVDYVLLQSGRHLHSSEASGEGGRVGKRGRMLPPKHVLLDAGTSTFDSSLYWFTCGYSQRGISFDSVHAWEMTLLHPRDYWQRVPKIWKPFWHFYNTPISSEPDHPDNPLRMLRQLVTARDFVALKLDIDHPETEMPLAVSLLSGDGDAMLIDEFFFELHFRCEVMTSCGWGKRVPASSHGLTLDRPSVLKFFLDLRRRGIRAHIWP